MLLVAASNMQVYAATDYTIEAENYSATNWKYVGGTILNSNSNASGGKYISLKMDTDSDTAFYTEYNVDVAAAGYYKVTLNSTPVTKTGWSSPIYINVNEGNDILLGGTKSDSEAVSGTGMYTCDSDVVYLNAGENTVRIIVKDKNDDGRYVSSIDKISFTASSFKIDGIYSNNPFMVFESGSPADIYVKANGISNTSVQMRYDVTTYDGTDVTSGSLTIPAGEKTGVVSISNLDKGSYIISVGYSGQTVENFFSVVSPKSSRTVYADTPFALDTNMISLYNKYSDSKDYVENYAKALDLMGISYIRDRISMNSAVSKNGDKITANTQANNYIGKAIKKHSDIKISLVINDLPDWMIGKDGKVLECNTVDVYNAFKALGDALGDNVDVIEIMNEVDAGGYVGNSDAPNLYATLFKAAAAGINDSTSDAIVISQGASAAKALDYIDILYKNEVFSWSSADNYHFHDNYETNDSRKYVEFPGVSALADIKAMQQKNGKDKPIWITEAGLLIKCGSDTELSAAQQYAQAKYVITSAAEAIANGVDKNFYFLGTEYQENGYTTGIMTKNDAYPSFYPAYAAMSAMTDILGEAQYLGNINSGDARGYVFKNGTKEVIVAYSVNGAQTLNVSGSYKKYDMFGNQISGTSGNVSLTEEPVFIVSGGTVSGIDKTDAHTIESVVPAILTKGDRIVVSQDYSDTASVGARNGAYYIDSNDNTVTVTVSNLNNEDVSGILVAKSDAGWDFEPETQEFSLGAFESDTYTFVVKNFADVKESIVTFQAICDGTYSSVSAAKVKSGTDDYMKSANRHWINATNYSAKSGAYENKQYSESVNGSIMELYTKDYETPLIESTLSYKFNLASAGTYNIWMLASDSNTNHMTKWKWRYDDKSFSKHTYWISPDAVYSAGGQSMYWYKVGNNIALSAGEHSIDVMSDALRGGNYNDYMLQRMDSIVIVPTSDSWWSPDGKSNGETVTAFENRNFASNFDFTNVTDDLDLPTKTATGANVSWASSNTDVINNNGKVHRTTVEQSATLTATITYGASSTTVSIPVTVGAVTDLLPTLTFVDENDNIITEFNKNRDNFVKVSATNILDETANAFIYIAGFNDESEQLKSFKTVEISAESGETIHSNKILIPAKDSVTSYKIFTWNGEFKPLLGVAKLETTMLATETEHEAIVTISGNCERENEKLTLTVVKESEEKLSTMSKSEVKKVLCYIGETTTDDNGNYVIRFKLKEANGKYKVNIQYSSGSKQSLFMVE